MIWAFSLFGAAFAGVTWGICIALANTNATWWDAVSAVGTAFAALGTVGTLAFQARQNAKMQNQLRFQDLVVQHSEEEILRQWLKMIREIMGFWRPISADEFKDMAAEESALRWGQQLEAVLQEVQTGRARFTTKLGNSQYFATSDLLHSALSIQRECLSNSSPEMTEAAARCLSALHRRLNDVSRRIFDWKVSVENEMRGA